MKLQRIWLSPDPVTQDEGPGADPRTFLQELLGKPTSSPTRPKTPSPYLTAQQAADYLQLTVKALYGLVERRKLRPMPGHRRYRFTVQQLDAFLRGE